MEKTTTASFLQQSVTRAIEEYFQQLDGEMPSRLYELVIREVEKPLLEVVLNHTANNQSLAASILGISRGTLRKKLRQK